jgi:anti-anti-sigma factor
VKPSRTATRRFHSTGPRARFASESLQILNGPTGDRFAVLRLIGRLDASGARHLGRGCEASHAAGRDLVLNLGGLSFFASAGVGALIATAARFRESARRLRLVSLPYEMDSAIRLRDSNRCLLFHATEGDALTALRSA